MNTSVPTGSLNELINNEDIVDYVKDFVPSTVHYTRLILISLILGSCEKIYDTYD